MHKATVTLLAKTSLYNPTTRTSKGNGYMRFFVIVLMLCALMMPVVAQQNFKATSKKVVLAGNASPATNCTAATHAHRFGDMRLALVEITSADSCGCDFVNLEDNTTGLDNHFQYGDGFIVTRANNDKPEAQMIHSEVLNPRAVRKGTRGIAVYCGTCKALMMLKVTGD
jgi:hypothetical protein